MVAKHVNKKCAGKPRFLVIDAFLHSLAVLAASSSAVAFYCYLKCLIMMQSYRQSEFCGNSVSRIRPRLGGLPHLETFTWQNLTPAARVTRSGRPGYPPWRSPHLSCKRDERLYGQAGYPTLAGYPTYMGSPTSM